MSRSKPTLSALTLMTLAAAPAMADGAWTLGLGVGAESAFYKGDDDDAEIIPYVAYDSGPLHLGLDGISYAVVKDQPLGFALTLAPRIDPDMPDTALFRGLDRDTAIEAGFSASYDFDGGYYTKAALMHDISGEHDGFEADLSLGTEHQAGPVTLDLSAGARYRDKDLSNYYVGVSRSEANSRRAAYSAEGSFSPYVALSATLPVGDRTAVVGSLSHERFSDELKDSPLVDEKGRTSAAVMLILQF